MTTITVYGPTGTADDSGLIQSALDAAYALADPSVTTVLLEPGTYLIQRTLFIGSLTRLVATGCTLRRNASWPGELLRCRNTAPVTGYLGEHDWEIDGGTWDGNRYAVTDGDNLISWAHCRNVTVRNADFVRCFSFHCIESNSSRDVLIEDCRFTDSAGTTEAIQFDVAHSTAQYPWFGAYDDTPCQTMTVRRCVFQDGIVDGIGSHFVQPGKPHCGLLVEECAFHVTGIALKLNNYLDVSVIDCAGVAGTWMLHTCDGRYVASDYDNIPDTFALADLPLLPPVGGPEPMHITLYTNDGGSGQHSNLPASPTELWGNNYHRAPVDLSTYTQIRVGGVVKNAGAATCRYGLQYSADGVTWDWCDGVSGPAFLVASTGPKVSGWVSLVAGARADVWVRPMGVDGNGVADPGVGSLYVEAR